MRGIIEVKGNLLSTGKSKSMEREVLDYFAKKWNLTGEDEPECNWLVGATYLDVGSSEGNVYGMLNGRDYLSGKKPVVNERPVIQGGGAPVKVPRIVYEKPRHLADNHAYTPIYFYSQDAHYSLAKAAFMLDIKTFHEEGLAKYPGQCPLTDDGDWPAEVPSDDSGAINIDSLATLVEFFASKGYPIFVSFNYGTTFKGAYDDVASACAKLQPILAKYGLLEREVTYDDVKGETKVEKRTGYWFHVHGGHAAAHMPYIEMAYDAGKIKDKGPSFDFRLPMLNSMAMSGLKGIGPSAVPGGIFLSRTKYQMMPTESVEYIGTPSDNTSTGPPLPNAASLSLPENILAGLPLVRSGIYMNRTKGQMMPSESVDYIGTPSTGSPLPNAASLSLPEGILAGLPLGPSGINMNRTKGSEPVDYIGTPDTTTTSAGSFNALSSMLLWGTIARQSDDDRIQKVLDLEELAAYTESRLRHLQDEVLHEDLYVERIPFALNVVFKRASDEICKKYSLSNADWGGRRYSQVFVTEQVTRELVDAFIEDLSQEGAFAT